MAEDSRKILVDADACPVVELALKEGKKAGVSVVLITDTSHQLNRPGATVVTVDKGRDSADFYLVNIVHPGDIVVTQDYGLAAMALAKKAVAVNQNGLIYTEENMGGISLKKYAGQAAEPRARQNGPGSRTKVFNKH